MAKGEKFRKFEEYFARCSKDVIELSFEKIEEILCEPLSNSAYKYSAYWSNDGSHSISNSWINAGYKSEQVDVKRKTIVFKKYSQNIRTVTQKNAKGESKKNNAMNTNSQNPKTGKDFEQKVLKIAESKFNQLFSERPINIGHPPKEHKFDCVSDDGKTVIECKCYTFTNGNNIPSAKMSTLNEAVLYLSNLPKSTRKIIALKKVWNKKETETLAQYYVRTNGHLLGDIEVWDIDDKGKIFVVRNNNK